YKGLVEYVYNDSYYTGIWLCDSYIGSVEEDCIKLTTTPGEQYYVSNENGTKIYVPHYSTIVIENDTVPPLVDITNPVEKNYSESDSEMVNLRVEVTTSADASSCLWEFESTNRSLSKVNSTYYRSGYLRNYISSNGKYNITVYCYDDNGNYNSSTVYFNFSDTTNPTISGVDETVGKTSATITWNTDEYTDSKVSYGKSSSSLDDSESDSDYVKSHSITITGLNSGTKYYYEIKSCDVVGNCDTYSGSFTTETDEETQNEESEAPSSEGGATGEATVFTQVWFSIPANEKQVMSISSVNIAIKKIEFELYSTIDEQTSLTVRSYGNTVPEGIPKAPNNVYQYLAIDGYTIRVNLKSAKVTFEIPASWFTNNNYDPQKVRVYHYVEGEWQPLFTAIVSLNGNYYKYYFETTSFSKFAITADKKEFVFTPKGELNITASVPAVGVNETNGSVSDNQTLEEVREFNIEDLKKVGVVTTALLLVIILYYLFGIKGIKPTLPKINFPSIKRRKNKDDLSGVFKLD
ncbi:MAG: PGF-pre-PGF domain-containing protein, partial [Candidatus Aenigmarchaeota archaeon]|nr:PGF-pre-PGF domain-containing protein [Candidatus Aenigmarchaeota archaeon]